MGLFQAHAPMVRLARLRKQRDDAKAAQKLAYEKKQRAKRLRGEATPLWNLLRRETREKGDEARQIKLIKRMSAEALDYKDGVNVRIKFTNRCC